MSCQLRSSLKRVVVPYSRSLPSQPPNRRAALTVLGVTLLVFGCGSPSPSPTDRLLLDQWLECVECNHGELAAVRARGNTLLPPLREVLLNGPDSGRVRKLRDYLAQRARRIYDSVPLPPIHPPPPAGQLTADEQQLVDAFLSNYTALVQRRAALALAKIGGADAKQALQRAGALSLRSDVHDFVVYAHDSLWRP